MRKRGLGRIPIGTEEVSKFGERGRGLMVWI
jgi:hypothetical protein